MISRYMTPDMDLIWSKEDELIRLCRAASVTAAVSDGPELSTAVDRVCSPGGRVNIVLWDQLEAEYDHDIAAFVEMVRRALPEEFRDRWHRRRTSSDLVEVSLALAVRESQHCLVRERDRLASLLARLALDHQSHPVMGRTHGQIAEPTTIGRKFALFAVALDGWDPRPYESAKVSGPVGTDVHPEDHELLAQLGLHREPATQIVPRWHLVESISSLLPLSVILSSLATEIRLASQSGIAWLREKSPSEAARGSSAMPHKRNPIRSERAAGLCKLIRTDVLAVTEAAADLWNERDISHSSVERTALVEALALSHFVLSDLAGVIERLEVFPSVAAVGTEGPTGVGAVEALVAAGLPYSTAYQRVRDVGPVQACTDYRVDGRGTRYDPRSEPDLWSVVSIVASRG